MLQTKSRCQSCSNMSIEELIEVKREKGKVQFICRKCFGDEKSMLDNKNNWKRVTHPILTHEAKVEKK